LYDPQFQIYLGRACSYQWIRARSTRPPKQAKLA
jgi:hypothetical protein